MQLLQNATLIRIDVAYCNMETTDIPELEAQDWMDRLGLGFQVVIKEAPWANRFLEEQND
jgi:hypothetical protein